MLGVIELLRQLNRKRLKKVNVLKPVQNGSLHNQLYHEIVNGSVNTEEDIQQFYATAAIEQGSVLMSRMRFKEKVLNLALHLDPSQSLPNAYSKSIYKLNRYLFFSRVLPLIGAFEMSLQLCQKAILIGQKHKHYDLTYEALKQYMMLAARAGDKSNWDEYNQLFTDIKQKKFDIDKIEMLHAQILYAANTNNMDLLDKDEFDIYINDIERIAKSVPVPRVKEVAFQAADIYYQYTGRYHQLLLAANRYLFSLEKSTAATNKQKSLAIASQITAYLHLKEFEYAEDAFEKLFELVPETVINFLYFKETQFLTYMHSQQYVKAFFVFNEVKNSHMFIRLPELRKERWTIYEPFLLFALSATNNELSSRTDELLQNFKIYKFLNSVPNYSKDKEHFNVQIRIAQMLHFISLKKFGTVIDSAESLKVYNKRYMRRKDNYQFQRSHHFIKALLHIPKNSFQYEPTVQKAQNEISSLMLLPYNSFNNNHLEIIPYENLWGLITNQLKQAS